MSGSTVDEELERVEAELRGQATPKIETPDEMAIADGSSCFLDINRACGPDCRAYDTGIKPAQGPEVCVVLSSLMDVGDAAKPLIDVVQTLRKTRSDRQREAASSQPVPDPTGRKRP